MGTVGGDGGLGGMAEKKERVGLLQQQGVILAAVEDDLEAVVGGGGGGGGGRDEDGCEAGRAIADSCQALSDIAQMVCGPSNPTPAQPPSRHSPPTSRPPRSNSPKPPLDGLGGLQEAWATPKHWDEFVLWLKSQSEGDDPDGVPKLLSRYATWLELYARLDAEERAGAGRERLESLTKGMMEHEEGFLDKYRCLSCWDGGMRGAALG